MNRDLRRSAGEPLRELVTLVGGRIGGPAASWCSARGADEDALGVQPDLVE